METIRLVVFAVLPSGGDWPRSLTFVDIAWGAAVSAAGASAGAWVLRWLVA